MQSLDQSEGIYVGNIFNWKIILAQPNIEVLSILGSLWPLDPDVCRARYIKGTFRVKK